MRTHPLRLSLIAAAVLATLPGHVLAARVDYTVDLGMERNSNVTMAPVDPIEQRYLRAGVGFSITENISALQLNLDGRAEYRDYEDDIFADTVDGTLSGRLNWVAIPERLFFLVEDNLTVQPVDSLVPDGPGNRQQGDFAARCGHRAAQVEQRRQQQGGAREAAVAGVEHQCQHQHRAGKAAGQQPPAGSGLQPGIGARTPAAVAAQAQAGMGQYQQVQADQGRGPQPFGQVTAGDQRQFGPQADAGGAQGGHGG